MNEKQMDFRTLSEAVIAELKGMEYMDSSLIKYRSFYTRLGSLMEEHSIKEYSPTVGKALIDEYYSCDTDRRKMILLMIRRLDDHFNGIPYRCHRAMKTTDVPSVFAGVINDYLEHCTEIGNKPGTINKKTAFV